MPPGANSLTSQGEATTGDGVAHDAVETTLLPTFAVVA